MEVDKDFEYEVLAPYDGSPTRIIFTFFDKVGPIDLCQEGVDRLVKHRELSQGKNVVLVADSGQEDLQVEDMMRLAGLVSKQLAQV